LLYIVISSLTRGSVRQEQNRQVIVIEPANPDSLGALLRFGCCLWWLAVSAYPPYYFGYPGDITGAFLAAGVAFGRRICPRQRETSAVSTA
jgi:hypothetical protein